MRYVIALTIVFFIAAACSGCRQDLEAASSLAVFEATSLKEVCGQAQASQVIARTEARGKGWALVSLQLDPCPARGAALAERAPHNLAVLVYPAGELDPSVKENLRRTADLYARSGTPYIYAPTRNPGDVASAVREFSRQHPGYVADNIDFYAHGHGLATTDAAGNQDTLMAGVERPGVDSPQVPVARASFEGLSELSGQGILRPETNCMLAVGMCQAGGAIQGVEQHAADFRRVGLDGAIGAARADEPSWGFENRQGLPDEALIHDLARIRTDPRFAERLDASGDGLVSMGEYRAQNSTLISSSLPIESGAIYRPNPRAGEVIRESEMGIQHPTFTGDENTIVGQVMPAAVRQVEQPRAALPYPTEPLQAPVQQAPVQQAPVQQAPVQQVPAQQVPAGL